MNLLLNTSKADNDSLNAALHKIYKKVLTSIWRDDIINKLTY